MTLVCSLANDIDKLDSDIREKNAEVLRSRKQIEATLPAGVKLDAYTKLVEDTDIDSKITAKQAELTTAKQADTVSKKAAPSRVSVPAISGELSIGSREDSRRRIG